MEKKKGDDGTRRLPTGGQIKLAPGQVRRVADGVIVGAMKSCDRPIREESGKRK